MNERWILLSDARRKILWWWSICTTILFVFVMIQFVNGKFEGIEGIAWTWFGVSVVPGLSLLYTNIWLNRYPAKIIHPSSFRAIFALSVGYVVIVLLTLLLSQRAIDQNEYGLGKYFLRTFRYLIPLNLLVLTGFWLIFFKKESILKPNPKIITDTADANAEKAKKHGLLTQARCYELIASNDLPAAYDLVQSGFQKKNEIENLHQVVTLQGEYSGLIKAKEMNTIDPELAQRTLNRNVMALLNLVTQISE